MGFFGNRKAKKESNSNLGVWLEFSEIQMKKLSEIAYADFEKRMVLFSKKNFTSKFNNKSSDEVLEVIRPILTQARSFDFVYESHLQEYLRLYLRYSGTIDFINDEYISGTLNHIHMTSKNKLSDLCEYLEYKITIM